MSGLEHGLAAAERVILAIDTSEEAQARQLAEVAAGAGATMVKMGLEISSATSWRKCSKIAASEGLGWIADAKIDDISNTTAGIVTNLAALDHPPVGITIHTNSGIDSMLAAQEIAAEAGITMLAVTHLTSIEDAETKLTYGFLRKTLVKRRALRAAQVGIPALVASPKEIRRPIKNTAELAGMITMIPGTRSVNAETHDQKKIETPFNAILDGADLLVIGRQVTEAKKPKKAFKLVVNEIDLALNALSLKAA